jgi:hypothetical protein
MADGAAIERPVLWGQVSVASTYSPTTGGGAKVDVPGTARQGARLGSRFESLDDAFDEQVALTQTLGASDPQLVLVFEAIDERADLARVAELAGLELLTEAERDFDPDSDFPRRSVNQDLPVTGCLHAICVNEQAKSSVIALWNEWQRSGNLPTGYAPLRDLFSHLKDVRPWGPQDRVRMAQIAEAVEGMLPGEHEVELELWFRLSGTVRQRAEDEVANLIGSSGGRVLSTAQVAEVGYHGMKCLVPVDLLRRLAVGDFDAISAVKSSHVMYLRASVQSHSFSSTLPAGVVANVPRPSGDPVLCVLDGVPVANHPLLAGRIVVSDPDNLSSATATTTNLRRHGTAMASACVWGDRADDEAPASRPVLVRPILSPATDTRDLVEELQSHELAPDLMRRVFRELFDGDGTIAATAPSIVVMNLSVGDPGAPFDGLMSSWARTIDWLSAEYGVIVIVSAGNYGSVVTSGGASAVTGLAGAARASAVNDAVASTAPRRSLLAPADSINALTVGALNQDGSALNLGYRVDPGDGHLIVSPISALGAGHRRSVKPDLVAPGGRTLFQTPVANSQMELTIAPHAAGPGVRVAAADGSSEVFTTGTSPAAAVVSRAAARAVDVALDIAPRQLTRSELAVSAKALVAHSARVPDDLLTHTPLDPYVCGYGSIQRSLADGCDPNEAAVLFVGDLGANEQRTLALPIPSGLQQTGIKRLTATLAWMSPINWRHRQYRRAALDFVTPTGFTNLGSVLDVPSERAKRGTLQHAAWEVTRAVASGPGGSIDLQVRCKEQAGGLGGERIDFAVVLSLWVAPELGVDVHAQVQQQIGARVTVTP